MTYENNEQYQNQLKTWMEAKECEKRANAIRLQAEKALLQIVKNDLNLKGVNNFPDGLKITTGMTESFEQLDVDTLFIEYEKGRTELPYFPFDTYWKPNNIRMKAIKELSPGFYKKYIEPLLTVKPKKPAFEIKVSK